MSDNTALIQDLFESIAQEGWSTKFNDALADDLVWVATGFQVSPDAHAHQKLPQAVFRAVFLCAGSVGPCEQSGNRALGHVTFQSWASYGLGRNGNGGPQAGASNNAGSAGAPSASGSWAFAMSRGCILSTEEHL